MPSATLTKWGNSQGIIIPKSFCDKLGVKLGDKFELKLDADVIRVKPQKSYTLESLMAGYDGPKPEEYEWGEPKGKELW